MSIGKSSLVIIARNLRQNCPAGKRQAADSVKPGGTIELPPTLPARADEAIE
jgi:hypothetical protein